MPSVSVKDVNQQDFTVALAAHLKKSGKMKIPEWVDLVKTNNRKELAPYDEDWFFVRCASIARHMYIRYVNIDVSSMSMMNRASHIALMIITLGHASDVNLLIVAVSAVKTVLQA